MHSTKNIYYSIKYVLSRTYCLLLFFNMRRTKVFSHSIPEIKKQAVWQRQKTIERKKMNITQENRDKKRIFQGKRETRRQSVSETELWPCPACNINQEVFLFQKKPHTPQYKLKGNSKRLILQDCWTFWVFFLIHCKLKVRKV